MFLDLKMIGYQNPELVENPYGAYGLAAISSKFWISEAVF